VSIRVIRGQKNLRATIATGVKLFMPFPGIPISLAFGVMFTVSAFTDAPAESPTGIEGMISVSPWHPGPVRVDEPVSRPLANATFAVQDQKEATVAEFTTDAQGRFRVSLAPGRYKVSLKNKKSSIGKYGPFQVDVTAGRMTAVQWQCDSGMR
jgi:hypothetical protein